MELKKVLKEVIEDNYINKATQYKYNTATQKEIIAIRRGVCDSCSSIINCEKDEEKRGELIKYAKELIAEQEDQGVQELSQ